MLNKKLLGTFLFMVFATVNVEAATYYVAKNGNDNANGSSNAPWKTINRAMNKRLNPGDIVIVRPGIYTENVKFKDSGSAQGGYITLRSSSPGAAKVNANGGSNAIEVYNKSYIRIQGMEVYGAKGSGILINYSHHVETLDNIAHDNRNAGIYFGRSDYILMEGNEAFRNSAQGPGSGLAVKYPENRTGNQSTVGFRIIVRNNVSYDNITKDGPTTDGCGIILDDFQFVNFSGKPYNFKSLVENNLVFGNYGRGIQLVHTNNVTVRNNTAYHNNLKAPGRKTGSPWLGELNNLSSSNNKWINNIGIANEGVAIGQMDLKGHASKNVVWRNNLTFDSTGGGTSLGFPKGARLPTAGQGNKLGVNPRFVNPAMDNFELQQNSPAVDSGTTAYGVPPYDLNGEARVIRRIDMGPYER